MAYEHSDTDLPPVTDWVNDWDWLDPQWGPNAIDIWNDVRRRTDLASTERYGRAFMPVTMDAVSQVAHDTEHFSSIWVSVARPDARRVPAPPITSDPPDHQGHRRLLLPSFSPKAIAPMEEELRHYCRGLIADLDGPAGLAERADAAEQYSQHIPVHGIAQLLGVPEDDADMFRDWIYRNFQLAPRDNTVRDRLMAEMAEYFATLMARRLEEPADDLITLVANAEIDGRPVSEELKLGYLRLLILAGIDTTWSAIGSGLWHFAQHPEQRAALVAADDDDLLWNTATEEVLRYYAPVTMGRKIVGDTEVAGCPVHAGDQMLLTFPAANHDPEAFDAPDEFRVDRARNRHVAFGLGIHRCLGSNLARLELVVALQEWLRAFPHYELDPAGDTTWANGQVRGPRNIPVLLNRAG
jgi:cytochrome P450